VLADENINKTTFTFCVTMKSILKLGNPVLRQVCRNVLPNSAETKHTVKKLFETASQHPCWGISAPQIGISERIFLMVTPVVENDVNVANKRNDNPLPTIGTPILLPDLGFNVHYTGIVNPRVLEVSEEVEIDYETCLSAPGIAALIPRHCWVDVSFYTHDYKKREHRLYGHQARLFQHEIDHLDGIVFLDRILDTCDIVMESEVRDWLNDDSIAASRYDEDEELGLRRKDSPLRISHEIAYMSKADDCYYPLDDGEDDSQEADARSYFASMYVLS